MRRFYRLALHVLPRAVREAHGSEMAAVFEQLLHDRRRRGGQAAAWRASLSELVALFWFAWCAHRGAPAPSRIDERMFAWAPDTERTLPMRESLLQDLRYAARLLARTPGFTIVCVLTMAIAIGANAAVFSLVHGVLLEELPFPEGDRLVVVGHLTKGGDGLDTTTPGNLYDWQARAAAFESMAGFAYTQRVITRGDYAERVLGALSAGSIFDVLARAPIEGRTFTAADDGPGAPAVVVLSYGFSRRLFGERSAVGESLQIGGVPYAVIGVMPPDFAFPDYDAAYWVPARFDAQFRGNRDQYFLLALARLGRDVSVEQSLVQVNTVMDAIRRDYPQHTQNATGGIVPLKAYLVQGAETRLWMLLGSVVLVLVIACANIGNLLLARGAGRRREMALRHAIGARPQRLIRQMLTESVLLVALGGAAGLALGAVLVRALVAWLAADLPRGDAVGLDGTVLTATTGVTVLCGLAVGLWPAWHFSSERTADALRQGTRDTGRTDPVRTGLVITEVALAFAVLVGAGLLARSFSNLLEVRPGFEPAGVLTFNVSLPGAVYRTSADRYTYFERAVERLRTLPGVTAVALSTTVPVAGRGVGAWFNILDRPVPAEQTPPAIPYRVVSPNYFETLGIPLKRGRGFTTGDGLEGKRAVIVSEAVERRFWPGGSALGEQIYLGAPDNRLFEDAEIVGVVGDVKQTGLDEAVSEAVYIPHRLAPGWLGFWFVLRTALAPTAVIAGVRVELQRIDAAVPIHTVQTMDDIVSRSLAPARSSAYLLGVFALMALVLAVVGVFGVLSYTVSQRRSELAIRLALGAQTRSVMLLVLGQGLRHVVMGVAVGVALCVPLARYIQGLLFNVRPIDPVTLAGVAALLVAVAGTAVYVPCRRATRVDPVMMLRES
ncbi:MAG TPA: ABC transporter permease [Vicinamibacterales bacterium]|nr:ABC transporter permease [Vicinamibacterales bacterium]